MKSIKHFQGKAPILSRQDLQRCCELIEKDLSEMTLTAKKVYRCNPTNKTDRTRLLYLGSLLYDYYLLSEEILLLIAKTVDRWVPASPDWRERLIILMLTPREGKRPPILSKESAMLLRELLSLYLNFHHQCAKLTASRLIKLSQQLRELESILYSDLSRISRLTEPR